jgi:hypothetical protein
MLTSGMREGSESTIRLTSAYPQSLRKLLLSFYEDVLEIASAEELIEMLYLADEYDMPNLMKVLQEAFSSTTAFLSHSNADSNRSNATIPEQASFEFTLENARLFLTCSAKIGLKLESKIFAGLAQQWWEFGPMDGKNENYDEHIRKCQLLLDALEQ